MTCARRSAASAVISRAAERAAAGSPHQTLLATAIGETDDLLDLFAALLAISEVEGQSVRSLPARRSGKRGGGDRRGHIGRRSRKAGMTIAVAAPPIFVLGERRLLQHGLANLLDNALTHTPAGTHIRIAVEAAGDRVRDPVRR